MAQATLEPSEVQDLGDSIPELLAITSKANFPLQFHVHIQFGDGATILSVAVVESINAILKR